MAKGVEKSIFDFPIDKMLTANGFLIDFEFRDKKLLPWDVLMVMASPWLLNGIACLVCILFSGNLYAQPTFFC